MGGVDWVPEVNVRCLVAASLGATADALRTVVAPLQATDGQRPPAAAAKVTAALNAGISLIEAVCATLKPRDATVASFVAFWFPSLASLLFSLLVVHPTATGWRNRTRCLRILRSLVMALWDTDSTLSSVQQLEAFRRTLATEDGSASAATTSVTVDGQPTFLADPRQLAAEGQCASVLQRALLDTSTSGTETESRIALASALVRRSDAGPAAAVTTAIELLTVEDPSRLRRLLPHPMLAQLFDAELTRAHDLALHDEATDLLLFQDDSAVLSVPAVPSNARLVRSVQLLAGLLRAGVRLADDGAQCVELSALLVGLTHVPLPVPQPLPVAMDGVADHFDRFRRLPAPYSEGGGLRLGEGDEALFFLGRRQEALALQDLLRCSFAGCSEVAGSADRLLRRLAAPLVGTLTQTTSSPDDWHTVSVDLLRKAANAALSLALVADGATSSRTLASPSLWAELVDVLVSCARASLSFREVAATSPVPFPLATSRAVLGFTLAHLTALTTVVPLVGSLERLPTRDAADYLHGALFNLLALSGGRERQSALLAGRALVETARVAGGGPDVAKLLRDNADYVADRVATLMDARLSPSASLYALRALLRWRAPLACLRAPLHALVAPAVDDASLTSVEAEERSRSLAIAAECLHDVAKRALVAVGEEAHVDAQRLAVRTLRRAGRLAASESRVTRIRALVALRHSLAALALLQPEGGVYGAGAGGSGAQGSGSFVSEVALDEADEAARADLDRRPGEDDDRSTEPPAPRIPSMPAVVGVWPVLSRRVLDRDAAVAEHAMDALAEGLAFAPDMLQRRLREELLPSARRTAPPVVARLERLLAT